jgi:hypothetical protein
LAAGADFVPVEALPAEADVDVDVEAVELFAVPLELFVDEPELFAAGLETVVVPLELDDERLDIDAATFLAPSIKAPGISPTRAAAKSCACST